MTREDILREIVDRDIHSQGLSVEIVQRDVPQLYSAACEQFGTWGTALKYAGVSTRRAANKRQFSRERVLSEIRRLCRRACNLSAQRNLRRNRRLYDAARRHFGTWRLALVEAGIDLRHVNCRSKPRRLDKQAICEGLRKRHEAGLSLAWCTVCLEDRALATAARSAFYGWFRALMAAGLATEEYVTPGGVRWDRAQVIHAIQIRHREGKLLTYADVRRDNPALYAAAHRYFEDWRDAVRAAGFEPVRRRSKASGT